MSASEGVLFNPDAYLDQEVLAKNQAVLYYDEDANGPLLDGSLAHCGFTYRDYSGEVFDDPSLTSGDSVEIVVHAKRAAGAHYLSAPIERYWQYRKEVPDPHDIADNALRRLIQAALAEIDA